MRHRWLCATIGLVLAGCSSPPVRTRPAAAPPPAPLPPPPPPPIAATAVVRDLVGAKIGTVTFNDTHAGVLISGSVEGLGLGAHAVHIHERGTCVPPFTSAGAHFNPGSAHHGFRSPAGPHAGDLPNIVLPPAGKLYFEFLMAGATLKGPHGVLGPAGASIVFHTTRDDYLSDPSGNAGSRQACGVIVARSPAPAS